MQPMNCPYLKTMIYFLALGIVLLGLALIIIGFDYSLQESRSHEVLNAIRSHEQLTDGFHEQWRITGFENTPGAEFQYNDFDVFSIGRHFKDGDVVIEHRAGELGKPGTRELMESLGGEVPDAVDSATLEAAKAFHQEVIDSDRFKVKAQPYIWGGAATFLSGIGLAFFGCSISNSTTKPESKGGYNLSHNNIEESISSSSGGPDGAGGAGTCTQPSIAGQRPGPGPHGPPPGPGGSGKPSMGRKDANVPLRNSSESSETSTLSGNSSESSKTKALSRSPRESVETSKSEDSDIPPQTRALSRSSGEAVETSKSENSDITFSVPELSEDEKEGHSHDFAWLTKVVSRLNGSHDPTKINDYPQRPKLRPIDETMYESGSENCSDSGIINGGDGPEEI